MSKPKLISFSLCPYVQRAVIALKEKGVDYDIEFIDLRNKPDWFLEISPRGKVPVLIDDGVPLFESQAIVEYLDETAGGRRLAPEDAKLRARDRAWFAYASEEIFSKTWTAESATDESTHTEAMAHIKEKLAMVDEALAGRQFLSGEGTAFGLADVAFAPALYRAARWKELMGIDLLEGMDHVQGWAQRVLALEAVKNSVPDIWDEHYKMMADAMGTHLGKLWAA